MNFHLMGVHNLPWRVVCETCDLSRGYNTKTVGISQMQFHHRFYPRHHMYMIRGNSLHTQDRRYDEPRIYPTCMGCKQLAGTSHYDHDPLGDPRRPIPIVPKSAVETILPPYPLQPIR